MALSQDTSLFKSSIFPKVNIFSFKSQMIVLISEIVPSDSQDILWLYLLVLMLSRRPPDRIKINNDRQIRTHLIKNKAFWFFCLGVKVLSWTWFIKKVFPPLESLSHANSNLSSSQILKSNLSSELVWI